MLPSFNITSKQIHKLIQLIDKYNIPTSLTIDSFFLQKEIYETYLNTVKHEYGDAEEGLYGFQVFISRPKILFQLFETFFKRHFSVTVFIIYIILSVVGHHKFSSCNTRINIYK